MSMSNRVQTVGDQIVSASDLIARQDYFIAIRRALILPFPLIMMGALALLVRYSPFKLTEKAAPETWLPLIYQTCDLINAATFGIAALVVLSGFSAALTHLHNKKSLLTAANPAITTTVTLCCFVLIAAPTDGRGLESVISMSRGLLTATITATISSTLFLKLLKYRYFRLPVRTLSHDPLVGDVFGSLPAACITILIFASIKTALIYAGATSIIDNLNAVLSAPFQGVESNLVFALIYEVAAQMLWFLGLHGPGMLYAVAEQTLVPAAMANHAAVAQNLAPEHIFTSEFFVCFARIGGSGSTLCLIIAMITCSTSPAGRRFALMALIPALCNINEPLLFGIPLILNPIFAIPFLLVPIIQIIIGYFAIVLDLMPMTSHPTIWTTPAILSGYMATGSIAGSAVQGISLVVGALVYFPFVRLNEQLCIRRNKRVLGSLLNSSTRSPLHHASPQLMGQFDEEGRMAIAIADQLQTALKTKSGLFLEYQPQIDIRQKRVVGVEALLRWEHPHYGRIAPPIIIALAEDLGIVDQVGCLVLEIACEQRVQWSKELDDDVVVSVNVAPGQLTEKNFDLKVLEILSRFGLPAHLLELEITETTALLPEMHSIHSLARLREAGVKIALDDFGMGHTSLHYLRLLPLDVVKIDRSLTEANSINEQIVKSIQELSASLNIATIVEGVEKDEQVNKFALHGCDVFQGYLFSPPLAADEIVPFAQSIGFASQDLEIYQDLFLAERKPPLRKALP